MSTKKQKQAVAKPTKSFRLPRAVRPQDAATADSRTIRFGTGMAPASLRKS